MAVALNCEDYSSFKVPVFAVSDWADGYSNAVFRLFQNLSVPRLGLVGFWGHRYPHMGDDPTVDFLGECPRFRDSWFKGVDTGIEEEPQLRVWMQDTTNPMLPGNPGRWVAEEAWPSANVENRSFSLGHHELVDGPPEAAPALTVQSPLRCEVLREGWTNHRLFPSPDIVFPSWQWRPALKFADLDQVFGNGYADAHRGIGDASVDLHVDIAGTGQSSNEVLAEDGDGAAPWGIDPHQCDATMRLRGADDGS